MLAPVEPFIMPDLQQSRLEAGRWVLPVHILLPSDLAGFALQNLTIVTMCH